jgi:predicted deacetylase
LSEAGEPTERHVLVVANETVAGHSLIRALERRDAAGAIRVTVICPVNHPREGYVVYEDTRRAAAGRRLDKTLKMLRDEGIPAHGLVVDADPVSAVKDAIAQLAPDEVIVSTHPEQRSGWMRRDVVSELWKASGGRPFEHVVVDLEHEPGAEANVLVVANETVLGRPLLDRIRARAERSPSSFLIVAPQAEAHSSYEDAEQRLRQALAELRGAGLEVHGQIAHPDPFSAAMETIFDERVDELIVSTFPGERSGWLRRDLVGRLRKETGLPVDHVVSDPARVEAKA